MLYDHRRREHLDILSRQLDKATDEQKAHLCAFCLSTGLMRPFGISLRLTCFVARISSPSDNGFSVLFATFNHKTGGKAVPDIWEQTIEHMAHGKDTSDETSAGGFNREELNLFIRAARSAGLLSGTEDIAA